LESVSAGATLPPRRTPNSVVCEPPQPTFPKGYGVRRDPFLVSSSFDLTVHDDFEMPSEIDADAGLVLQLLASADRGKTVSGPEITSALGMAPERVNDAVSLL
jgi:hypothetical protein